MWTFVMLPNCAVHVVMYIYYLCACLGPRVQKIITPWKKYITLLQLVRNYFAINHFDIVTSIKMFYE